MSLETLIAAALLLAMAAPGARAGPDRFSDGPVIFGHGKVDDVPAAAPIPDGTLFKVAFDVAEAPVAGKTNRCINSAARFIK